MKLPSVLLLCLSVPCLTVVGIVAHAHMLLWRRPLQKLYEERAGQSDFVPLAKIPYRLVRFALRIEDFDFYTHRGYKPKTLRKAILKNLQAKEVVYGGSTITQQLAKNLYLRFDRSLLRKAEELVIAVQAERELGKDKILDLYLNIIYYGNGVYGISDAARFYFGKEVQELSVNQMFILARLPCAPTRGNPIQYPEVFERRRNRRLKSFLDGNPPLISEKEAALISSYHADCLDPELREPDDWTRNYPQEIPQVNERFGPYEIPSYKNPMASA